MDLQEVRNKAREKMKGCHVCPQCNGKACIGMIPGFGGLRTGRSFMRNVEALQEYGLVMRSMSGVDDPDTTVTILGKTLSMPVLLAPVGGIVLNAKVDGDPAEVEQEYDEAVTQAALEAGTLLYRRQRCALHVCFGNRVLSETAGHRHSDHQAPQQRPDYREGPSGRSRRCLCRGQRHRCGDADQHAHLWPACRAEECQ